MYAAASASAAAATVAAAAAAADDDDDDDDDDACRYKATATRQIIIEVQPQLPPTLCCISWRIYLLILPQNTFLVSILHLSFPISEMPLQNHGIRVLLRLLARSLPPACLTELFGCLMNVAADVGGEGVCIGRQPACSCCWRS